MNNVTTKNDNLGPQQKGANVRDSPELQNDPSASQKMQDLLDVLGSPGGLDNAASLHPLEKVVARLRVARDGPAKGSLAELNLLGLADARTGELNAPGGFPRIIAEAVQLAAAGARAGGCGRCFFILGALMEQAERETLRSASFNVQEDGRVNFTDFVNMLSA